MPDYHCQFLSFLELKKWSFTFSLAGQLDLRASVTKTDFPCDGRLGGVSVHVLPTPNNQLAVSGHCNIVRAYESDVKV